MNNEEVICKNLAKHFMEKGYENLNDKEKSLYQDLVQAGWIEE